MSAGQLQGTGAEGLARRFLSVSDRRRLPAHLPQGEPGQSQAAGWEDRGAIPGEGGTGELLLHGQKHHWDGTVGVCLLPPGLMAAHFSEWKWIFLQQFYPLTETSLELKQVHHPRG